MARRRKKSFSVINSLNDVNTKVNRTSQVSLAMIILLVIAILMIGLIWQKIRFSQLMTGIEELKKQEIVLTEKNKKAKATLFNLLNDSRIIGIAQTRLNMIFPDYEVVKSSENFEQYKKQVQVILDEDFEFKLKREISSDLKLAKN